MTSIWRQKKYKTSNAKLLEMEREKAKHEIKVKAIEKVTWGMQRERAELQRTFCAVLGEGWREREGKPKVRG